MLLQMALFYTLNDWVIFHNIYVHIFFIHSSADLFRPFPFLAIVSSAAVNIGVHVSFQIIVLYGYMAKSGIAGSYGEFQTFIPVMLSSLPKYVKRN